jgi:uncharacterized protein with FMN-binding domain
MVNSRLGRWLTLGGIVGLSVGAVAMKGGSGSPPTPSGAGGGSTPITSSSSSSSSSSPSTSSTTQPGRASKATPARSSTTTTAPPAATRKVAGAAESFPFGAIQVELVLTGSHISNVEVLQAPQGGYSGQVAQFSLPTLRSEVLAAQSAHIDTVSGASYDSQAYANSVQSALDKAGA